MVKLLAILANNGGLTYSLVLPQKDRSGNPPIPPAAGQPGADDRIRQLTDKKFTSSFKFHFPLLNFPSIIFLKWLAAPVIFFLYILLSLFDKKKEQ